MGDDYYITVNVFNGSFTGHVNITLNGPNGYSYTFGNNTTDGNWGVRREFNDGRTDMFSTHYPVSYDQMMSMYNWVTGIMADPGNSYGLLGRNCVDFVRDMFGQAGLGNQISSLMQWLDTPVNHYAALTDWLALNGFGPVWDGIGEVLGFAGEVGSFLLNAATSAWNGLVDMATSAYNFISNIGDQIGGFATDLYNRIVNFFQQFSIADDPGPTIPEAPDGHRSTWESDDDFVFELSVDQEVFAQAMMSPVEVDPFPQIEIIATAANDVEPYVVDAGVETFARQDDWAFA
jgi:hypothetical protein